MKFPDHLPGDIRVWIGAGAVAVILVGLLLYRWRSRPPTPEEIERRRRLHVNQVGRIAEGRVTELIQTNPSDSGIRRRPAYSAGAMDPPPHLPAARWFAIPIRFPA